MQRFTEVVQGIGAAHNGHVLTITSDIQQFLIRHERCARRDHVNFSRFVTNVVRERDGVGSGEAKKKWIISTTKDLTEENLPVDSENHNQMGCLRPIASRDVQYLR